MDHYYVNGNVNQGTKDQVDGTNIILKEVQRTMRRPLHAACGLHGFVYQLKTQYTSYMAPKVH